MNKLDFLTSVYFDDAYYLSGKAAALNAQGYEGGGWTVESLGSALNQLGMTPFEHYSSYGAFETNAKGELGINPDSLFDQNSYYADKAEQLLELGMTLSAWDVASAFQTGGLTPLSHYSAYGYTEWVFPTLENIPQFTITSPVLATPLSNDYRIDALAQPLPEWYSPNAIGKAQGNVFYYAFPIDPANEIFDGDTSEVENMGSFNAKQIAGTETALDMISAVTGIKFEHTTDMDKANVVLFEGRDVGSDSTTMAYTAWANENQSVVVVNTTDFPVLEDLSFGTGNVQFLTVLHELCHAMGLKHPFVEINAPDEVILPPAEDNFAYSAMSYTNPIDEYGEEFAWYIATDSDNFFSPYDIAALQWIYGTDGLNGTEGQNYIA